jgi:hypothetical protein
MVKESHVALAITGLGVAFTGIIAWALLTQTQPTTSVAKVSPAVQPAGVPPQLALTQEITKSKDDLGVRQRTHAALFGGLTGADQSGGGQVGKVSPRARQAALFGGLTGARSGASGGETQFTGPLNNQLYTGTRYGKFLGQEIGGFYNYKYPRGPNQKPTEITVY